MNIVLCGMMGSGKTTVAAALNKLYGMPTVDTDEQIVKAYGSINKIFEERGEAAFRDIESQTVKEVAASSACGVISVGGGCVLREENVAALKRTGKIIYLRARPESIIQRLKGDNTRPLLKGGLEEKVHSILAARKSVYEQSADIIVDTDGLTPEDLAKIIKEKVQ